MPEKHGDKQPEKQGINIVSGIHYDTHAWQSIKYQYPSSSSAWTS